MNIGHALQLIPRDSLANGLRVNEDAVVGEVRGDVWAIQSAYRILARFLKGASGREPRRLLTWDELPPRLRQGQKCPIRGKQGIHRVCRRQFAALRERVESMVLEAGEHYIRLMPYVQMEMFRDKAQVDDRELRIQFYQKQIRWLERRYELTADASSRRGPKKRAVQALDGQGNAYGPFKSTRAAAEWVRTTWGRYCRRSDIRTGIRKNHRVCGFRWSYTVAERAKREKVKGGDQLELFAVAA